MEYNPDEIVYASTPLPVNTQRSFVAGPGEGLPFRGVSLNFEGVVRVEGNVLRFFTPHILDLHISVDFEGMQCITTKTSCLVFHARPSHNSKYAMAHSQ